jgi:signal transduction histidine kinase/CheY-like chemotaxis protein
LNTLSSLFYRHEFLFKYTLIPIIPLTFIALLSINPLLWVSSEIHHFYIELFAVVFGLVLSFYYILRARTINDNFSLFIGLGFLISALIDLLHVIISYEAISDPLFIKYFIPQTWFAGRIFLSILLTIAILKYSKIAKGVDEQYPSNEELLEQQNPVIRIQKRILFYLILLAIFSIGIALSSLYLVFPASVIDEYSLHRPYEIPPILFFSIALFYFYKKQLYKKKDLVYKGLAIYLILDIFSQIIMSYSAVSFDTAHNVSHVLKDAGYFVNVIALSLSSIQSNVELKKSNELIRVQNKKLKESGRMQKEFLNIAAHELRTPIQPILGLSNLLIDRFDKGSEYSKMAEVIYRNALKLQHLAQDILDVTKIESQTLNLNKEKFDLNNLIINSIADFENSTKHKSEDLQSHIKIVYKPNEQNKSYQSFIVEADKIRISQVLSNLLSNANKSLIGIEGEGREGEEGKKTKFIYVNLKMVKERKHKVHHIDSYNKELAESDSHERAAVISIQDEGSGIKSELRTRLYEKFATGYIDGIGLGLFISKNIIESHGGQLWFEDNKDGKGVTFYFTLPIFHDLYEKSTSNDSILKNPKGKDETTIKKNISSINICNPYFKDNGRMRILLVDDDEDINTTLKKVLEETGYKIQAYSNPIKALEDFKKNLYNLIILDIKMPQMNGFEFYNEIRKIDNKVKVCFLTAAEIDHDKYYEIFSKNIYLKKPIENEALLKIIENMVQ